MASNRQCRANHEDGAPRKRQDRQRGQRMHAGVRERVHLLHHQRGLREVPTGKAKNRQWRGHPLRHDVARFRELLGSPQDLPVQVSRNPPRKSEQATHWAVRFLRARRARCRSRESTACTERRLRNGRRRHRLRIHGPQRERERVLAESGSGGQHETRRAGRHLRKAFVWHDDHRKGMSSRRNEEKMGLRTPSLWPDCNKRATVAHSRWIIFEVIRRGTKVHKSSAGSTSKILLRNGLRLAGVGQDTYGQPRYLFASCSFPDGWSRSYFLLTRASQHSLYPLDTIPFVSRHINGDIILYVTFMLCAILMTFRGFGLSSSNELAQRHIIVLLIVKLHIFVHAEILQPFTL